MSAVAGHPHLRLLDTETGEVVDSCPHCSELEDQLAGLQRDIRGWASRYAELRRDKDKEARQNPLWPVACRVFGYWRVECKHPRAVWDVTRFELLLPFLKKDGEELCLRAIAGAAFDPFVTARKNGSKRRHDGFELIFRDRGKFEEFCNRAPRDWRPPDRVPENDQPAG